MGLPLPKTPLIALLSQILAFIFGILCFIPGQNGVLEGAYLLSFNTSMYGQDAMESSSLFYLNNSNPMFAVMTSVRPDFEHAETPPALKGMNDAIMKRLEINMSDPKTVKGIYDTPLKDIIGGAKSMLNGEEGQWKIANGMADFVKGMAMQMSGKMQPPPTAGGSLPAAAAPHRRSRRATTQAAAPNQGAIPGQTSDPNQGAAPNQGAVPNQGAAPIQGAVPSQGVVSLQAPGPVQAPALPDAPVSSPKVPQTPNLSVAGPGAPGNGPLICPKDCVPPPKPKDDGQPFGPPKPKPIIPPPGEWATGPFVPLENAIKENGVIISGGIKHGAIKAMNAQAAAVRQNVPIYDYYNIYNTGICWGFYKPDGPQTVGCGSSADWHNIDLAPRIKTMVSKYVSPTAGARIVGPIGLGPNMEKFLATMRILLLLMYINKIMTVVNQAFAAVIPLAAVGAMFGGMLPPRLHLKVSFVNFATSAIASGMVFGGTMSVLGMMLGMGLTLPPQTAMMSVDMRLGIPYILLCLVDSVFAIVGTVCWYKIWRMMVNGAKEQAESERASFDRQNGKVEMVTVQPNKEYDASWVRG
ncbi:SCP-like extracellular protein [Venturia nashicola]|uniref:SCP-like extracellular protein n=1 Tax=Venturia nashicola TaxID=86259 RepID=A0A4Z1NGR0_9PEZI|nr:SCP-like extracellular protein [Venturia nashicola]